MLDAAGVPCRPGVAGEVVVRGPNVMVGYWEDEEATEAAFVDGWYRTGDIGYLDDEHYLYLLDRAKDMIVTGGENVYSLEVEDALARHPAVLEGAVFGVPDDRWVEAVHAVVVVAAAALVSDVVAERASRPLPADDRRVQGAEADRDAGRTASQVGPGQDPEAPAARSVLEHHQS